MKGEFKVKPITIFLTGVLLFGLLGGKASLATAAARATRTDSGGGVTVKVDLLDAKASGEMRFQIALDTHSVNLDGYDLKSLTLLRDDGGNTYPPTGVENQGSGHHRQTILRFAKIKSGAKRIELVVRNVAGVKERLFRWELQ